MDKKKEKSEFKDPCKGHKCDNCFVCKGGVCCQNGRKGEPKRKEHVSVRV